MVTPRDARCRAAHAMEQAASRRGDASLNAATSRPKGGGCGPSPGLRTDDIVPARRAGGYRRVAKVRSCVREGARAARDLDDSSVAVRKAARFRIEVAPLRTGGQNIGRRRSRVVMARRDIVRERGGL